MMGISEKLKEVLQENRDLLADGSILELYEKLNYYSAGLKGELTDLLLDSGVNIWEYFVEDIPTNTFCDSKIADITIPDSIQHIGGNAFTGCWNVHKLNYLGTMDQWNRVIKEKSWAAEAGIDQVVCTDGCVELV